MIRPPRQFVPQDVCLKCDGCCRYKEETSAWRPKVSSQEATQAQGLAEKIFDKTVLDKKGYIKAHACGGHFQCHYFNAPDNTCRIYGARPFECALYPFLLTRVNNQVVVCMHLNCPHIGHTLGSHELMEYELGRRVKNDLLHHDQVLFDVFI